MYRICTLHGVLNGMYTRGQFEICKEKFMSVDDVPTTLTTTVRGCHAKSSITVQYST